MRRLSFSGFLLSLLVVLVPARMAFAETPLNALILTTQGVYHNYRQQTWVLAHRVSEHANVRFDVSLSELERWKSTDYSNGYDVLIYNICLADNTDAELIANMRRQTETLGAPALFIHCSMHSFRNTDDWWPLYGLKTTSHEPLRALTLIKEAEHPILRDLPDSWTLTQDELYSNLAFDGVPLLSTVGLDGKAHIAAWMAYPGGTPVFATTLGHSEESIRNPPFQRLLANALLYVTGNLSEDGTPAAGMAGDGDRMDIFESFSAPKGVKFLGEEGHDCAYRKLAIAGGPCYMGCILNPFEWGEATQVCKKSCESELPSPDELIKQCAPSN